jgi:hypothetical protein
LVQPARRELFWTFFIPGRSAFFNFINNIVP